MESTSEVTANKAQRCYACDSTDWHDIKANGKPVHSQMKVHVCKNCGNLCHEVDVSKEEEIKEFYRKEYRPQPNIMNLVTTTHKINYIRIFLMDFLKESKGKSLVVGDVGAATGYVLNFFRNLGHKVSGSELTITYRRMSEHYYGIPLAEELEPKHRYDLIVVYHVLEHLMDPDKKLAHYASLLADGGKILVATPEWLSGDLEDASGVPVQSFDHLFHKNHINLFTSTSIQNVFRKAGLKVAKEDHFQYGQTYLLEKIEGPRDQEHTLCREDWREVEKSILTQHHAIFLQSQGKNREAVTLCPKFPEAWLAMVFGKYSKDIAKQSDIMEEATKAVGHNFRFILARGQWNYQQGKLNESIEDLSRVLELKPAEDIYMYLGYAHAQAGHHKEAMTCFSTACSMDPRKWQEAQQWMLQVACSIPTWDERLLQEAAKGLKLSAVHPDVPSELGAVA